MRCSFVLTLALGAMACASSELAVEETIVPDPLPEVHAGIAGVVAREGSSEPLPNAIVLVEGGAPTTERETTTNSAGRYSIADVPAGTYAIQVLYGEAEVTRTVVHDGDTKVRADFAIDPDVVTRQL